MREYSSYAENTDAYRQSRVSFDSDYNDDDDETPTLNYANVSTPTRTMRPLVSLESDTDNIGIDINQATDHLNRDLINFDWNMSPESPLSRVPLMEPRSFEELDNLDAYHRIGIGIQSRMSNPYFMLEIVACMCFDLVLCSNAYVFTIITDADADAAIPLRFLVYKGINLGCLAIITAIFTTPDTYKSLNITIEYLAINAIIYEYQIATVLKYLLIRLVSGAVMAFTVTGIYLNLLVDYTTEDLVSNILFVASNYKFTYAYYITAVLLHISIAIGLTLLTDSATSTNARSRAYLKSLVIYFCRNSFGIVVGPVGYIWTNIMLYLAIVSLRNRFDLIDVRWVATYLITIVGIIVIYPLIAIQIKFIWRDKVRRYLEYKRN